MTVSVTTGVEAVVDVDVDDESVEPSVVPRVALLCRIRGLLTWSLKDFFILLGSACKVH